MRWQRGLLFVCVFLGDCLAGSFTSPWDPNQPEGWIWWLGKVRLASAPASVSFSPDPSVPYFSAQSITLSAATSGATIYYTTNGSDPACGSGTQYTGPITMAVQTALTIKAISCSAGGSSAVSTASYLNAPVFVGSYDTPNNGPEVAVVGNYAYVADGTGMLVIDVSNPAAPTLAGSRGCCSFGIHVIGNYAYTNTGNLLDVINISNPAAPTGVGNVACGTANSSDTGASGNYAYLLDTNGLLYSVDVSNPAAPVVANSYNFRTSPPNDAASSPNKIFIQGNYAYLTDGFGNNLLVVDISNPSAMTLAGSISPAGGGQKGGVHVIGTKAYVGDHTGADLRVIDVSNPAAPVQLGSVGSGGAERRYVYVSGSYAFQTIDNSGFRIYDISNSSAPALVGADTSVGANAVRSVFVAGKYAYLSGDFGLRIYQVFP